MWRKNNLQHVLTCQRRTVVWKRTTLWIHSRMQTKNRYEFSQNNPPPFRLVKIRSHRKFSKLRNPFFFHFFCESGFQLFSYSVGCTYQPGFLAGRAIYSGLWTPRGEMIVVGTKPRCDFAVANKIGFEWVDKFKTQESCENWAGICNVNGGPRKTLTAFVVTPDVRKFSDIFFFGHSMNFLRIWISIFFFQFFSGMGYLFIF